MKRLGMGLCLLVILAVTARAEVLVLKNNYFIDEVTKVTQDGEMLIYRHAGKIYEIKSRYVLRTVEQVPENGRRISPEALEAALGILAEESATPKTDTPEAPQVEEPPPSIRENPLRLQNMFWGYQYFLNEQPVSPSDFEKNLQTLPEAYSRYHQAQQAETFGTYLEGAGVVLIALPVVEYFTGQKYPLWGLAAIGGALIIPALAMKDNAYKNKMNAVKTYNYAKPEQEQGNQQSSWKPVIHPGFLALEYSCSF
ncbi:hypothetical protein JW933_03170 [candidate division FCPU426 bacterium]|nr:hypothetical protein [candidate division FCPU426 bacterium]